MHFNQIRSSLEEAIKGLAQWCDSVGKSEQVTEASRLEGMLRTANKLRDDVYRFQQELKLLAEIQQAKRRKLEC